MRWAGWILGVSVAVACGGAPPHDGSSDGGTGGLTTPDGGGPAPDAGPAADCDGLVPATPGSAFTFDVVPAGGGETCDLSAVDGEGVVAALARSASATTWYEFAPSYGTRSGNFGAPGAVLPQPAGFIGLWGTSPVNVALFTQGGDVAGPSPVGSGPVALGPAWGGGAISLSADSGTITVRKHDAMAAEIASATISGAWLPLGAAEDASGAVLALVASGSGVSGIWVDLAKATASKPFAVGNGSSARARALIGGGVLAQVDGRWAGVVQPGESTVRLVPAWLGQASDLAVARGGKAYALVPSSGGAVGIASPQGSSCGSVTFSGVSSVAIGVDGTVVGASGAQGCTKYVWRNALR